MNYVTKEYLIQLENFNKKNFAERTKNNNRATSYCRLRLGDDCVKSPVATTVEFEICPVCGQKRDCLVSEKYLSSDGRKKIFRAQCMYCDASFLSYQEDSDSERDVNSPV